MLQVKRINAVKRCDGPRTNRTISHNSKHLAMYANTRVHKTIQNITAQSNKTKRKPPLPPRSQPRTENRSVQKVLKHEYACDQRKENILQAKFLRKKEKLFEITRENVKIFQRINSQKSVYSHEALNKSYEDNRSMRSSRHSNQSNCSQVSWHSRKSSHKAICSPKKESFFQRSSSAKKMASSKPITVTQKRKSSYQIKPTSIRETLKEDLKPFKNLFNIKEEKNSRQRNRAIRIKSLQNTKKSTRSHKPEPQSQIKKPQFQQIVINQENELQIHEEIDCEMSKVPSCSTCNRDRLQNSNVRFVQSRLKSSKQSACASERNAVSQSRNLFEEIKPNIINSRIVSKLGDAKVSTKYSNLMAKINEEMQKSKGRRKSKERDFGSGNECKQNSMPFRSRLIF